ncbi:hypothetical protein LDL21_24015 [Nocardia sp. NEAU-G4]|nr:hypothetical protein [Nocardia rosealba]
MADELVEGADLFRFRDGDFRLSEKAFHVVDTVGDHLEGGRQLGSLGGVTLHRLDGRGTRSAGPLFGQHPFEVGAVVVDSGFRAGGEPTPTVGRRIDLPGIDPALTVLALQGLPDPLMRPVAERLGILHRSLLHGDIRARTQPRPLVADDGAVALPRQLALVIESAPLIVGVVGPVMVVEHLEDPESADVEDTHADRLEGIPEPHQIPAPALPIAPADC